MRLPPLHPGTLIRRYQRFLADAQLDGGERVTAHCPNTGSMLGLNAPGSRVWLSAADKPGRKLAWTWELAEAGPGMPVGVHTGRANGLVREALLAGLLPELSGFTAIRAETRMGAHSRIDLQLVYNDRIAWVEVKNVTAAVCGGSGYFPDAVSTRAVRHLDELSQRVRAGERAVLVFCVQRHDVRQVRPADHIDPAFGHALRQAVGHGVELYALGARVSPERIELERRLAIGLD